MKLRISHGADPGVTGQTPDWFVVKPLEGQTAANTPTTHDMAVQSLLRAGRAVYEADLDTGRIRRLGYQPEDPAIPGMIWYRRTAHGGTAIQWTGANYDAIQAFAGPRHTRLGEGSGKLGVLTYGGWKDLSPGDWVGLEAGELFCSADKTFTSNNERVRPSAPEA